MLGITKLVTLPVFCLLIGSLFGALVADKRGHNCVNCAAIGGVAGVLFGLIACSEMKGGNLFDVLFPPRGGSGVAAAIDGRLDGSIRATAPRPSARAVRCATRTGMCRCRVDRSSPG